MAAQVVAGVLVLAWFLALIGGFFIGGWINLLLLVALGIAFLGTRRGRAT